MTGDRSKQIRANVQRVLKATGQTEESLGTTIFEILNRIQRSGTESALNLEDIYGIDTESGRELYDFPEGFLNERTIMSSTGLPVKRLSMDEVRALKDQSQNTEVSDSHTGVLYYYKWAEQFGFLMADGALPSDGETLTVYYWRVPVDGEEISNTQDPMLDRHWDPVLFYGAVAEITGDVKWWTLYQKTFDEQVVQDSGHHGENLKIESSGDYE